MMTSMIIAVMRTVPSSARRSIAAPTSPPGSAIASAMTTPIAADSVGVAQPA